MKLYSYAEADQFNINDVRDLYRKHVNSTRVDLLSTFGFGRELASHSEGMYVYTDTGKKILDFTGGIGVLNHGHNHPRILAARKWFEDNKKMEVHKNYFSKYVAALSHNIASILPGDLNYSFFPNSGSEAVDGAMKTAIKYHEGVREIIVHSDIAFHGKLFGPASVTHSPENHFPYPKALKTDMFKYNDLNSVKECIRRNTDASGKCQIAGLILEPLNVSNMISCTPEFILGIRELCNENDIILIFDEVYSGWGKTGSLFNFMKFPNLIPDVLCMAKSFGGGKASISGIVTREKVFKKAFDNVKGANLQSSTYYGFGEETVTAIEAINILVEENLVERSRASGELITRRMQELKQKFSKEITDVRGQGCINGIFFNSGPKFLSMLVDVMPGELFDDPRFMQKLVTAAIVSELYESHNILTFTSLGEDIHLIVAPSLIVTEEEINHFFKALETVLNKGLISLVLKFAKNKFIKQ